MPKALEYLASHRRQPGYEALLEAHRLLFEALYPWAGQDRLALTPGRNVHKGATVFAEPHNVRAAFEEAMRSPTPGKVLGNLAYAHPFLECNGRALFTFFDDYLRRKGKQLDWAALPRDDFLRALDIQIAHPDEGHLDVRLDPHVTLLSSGARPRSALLDMA